MRPDSRPIGYRRDGRAIYPIRGGDIWDDILSGQQQEFQAGLDLQRELENARNETSMAIARMQSKTARASMKNELKIAKLNLRFQYDQLNAIGVPRLQLDQWVAHDNSRLRELEINTARDIDLAKLNEQMNEFNLDLSERTRQFNANLGLQYAQTGLEAAKTAASLTGPADWAKFLNYTRGASQNAAMPAFLQALSSGVNLTPFAAPQSVAQAPEGQSLENILTRLAGGAVDPVTGQAVNPAHATGGTGAMAALKNLGAAGGQSLRPGTLEALSPDEQAFLKGGLEDPSVGFSYDTFIDQYKKSGMGQSAQSATAI